MAYPGYSYGAPPAPGYAPPAPGYAPPAGYAPAPAAPAARFNPYAAGGWAPRDPSAWALFCAVDTDRSNSVSFRELQAALTHGGWMPFSARTTKTLIRMFDQDRSGTLGYMEFESLIGTMNVWRAQFMAADTDRSGKLSKPEVRNLVRTLGFALPDPLVDMIFASYDEDESGQLSFDEFIRLLAELSALTTAFRRYDPGNSGRATLDYMSFLHVVFSTRG